MKKRCTSMLLAMLLLFVFCCPIRTEAAVTGDSYKAVWYSYYDFQNYLKQTKKNNATNFRKYFDKVLDQCLSRNLNRIIVQVRPCSDAMYQSEYFPTSAYIARKQGAKLSYDPLKIMVTEAHKKGMAIEAWINPYRVSFNTNYKKLAKNNPARIWHYSSSASDRRNVLSYGGQLYYNPSKPEVRTLIINGVREIVRNYDVDGIHMDDYFYPSFSPRNYKKSFDAQEYNASVEKQHGKSIKTYRRQQVDLLVKGIKAAVKEENPDVVFGISPAGNIDNLNSKYSYYVNIKKWTNSTEYVDYIAPQVYWGFNHKTAPFAKVVDRWAAMVDQSKVKLYIGLPAYKVGHPSLGSNSAERKELKSTTILKKMVNYVQNKADGVIVFDYSDLKTTAAKKMGTALKKIVVFGK
ncbi:MAG: family 10 glycosylhydrolase [Lachnospiraceae bacterium]|nr:family 10 glycosylhydrolase [Lachnospiraceae bacterium]